MPFILNTTAAPSSRMAEPDSVDFDILVDGPRGTGVMTGLGVTANTPAGMSVVVATGTGKYRGRLFGLTGGVLAVPAADSSNPRQDLVIATISGSTGTASVVAGLPAGAPVDPVVPANAMVLALLDVPAGAPSIPSTRIVDKRVTIPRDQHVNVHDYGAVGDGVTNDKAAFQAALDAVDQFGGGRVYVPNSVYLVDQLRIGSKTELYGDGWGSILKLTAGVHRPILYNKGVTLPFGPGTVTNSGGATKITLRDLAFDGNKTAQGTSENATCVLFIHTTDVSCENLEVFNATKVIGGASGGEGLEFRQSQRFTVRGGSFHDNGYDGVKCQDNNSHFTIVGINAKNNGRSGIQISMGFLNYDTVTPGQPVGASSTDFTIAGCQIEHDTAVSWLPSTYITSGIYCHDARRGVIVGNQCRGMQNPYGVYATSSGCDDLLFAGNYGECRLPTSGGSTYCSFFEIQGDATFTTSPAQRIRFLHNYFRAISGAAKNGSFIHAVNHTLEIRGNSFHRGTGTGTWTLGSTSANTIWADNVQDGTFAVTVSGSGAGQEWTGFSGNHGVGGQSYGGGTNTEYRADGTAPTSNPAGGFVLYSAGGVPKARTSGGVVHQLTPLKGSLVQAIPALAPGESTNFTISVPGTAAGDVALVGYDGGAFGGNAAVSSGTTTNGVRVVIYNADTVSIGGASTTFTAHVWKQA